MTGRCLTQLTSTGFHPAEMTCLTGSQPLGLGGRVHRDEHQVGSINFSRHSAAAKQFALICSCHDAVEPKFKCSQLAEIGIIPGVDARMVDVRHLHLNLRAAISDQRSHPWSGCPCIRHQCIRRDESSRLRLISKTQDLTERIDRRIQALLQ